jgi:hypothetical protein
MPYIGKSPAVGFRNRFVYQATAGQTSFSGSDAGALREAIAEIETLKTKVAALEGS